MTRTNEARETRTAIAACATTPATDAQPVYPHTMRLQRFLARAGVASRRGSEDLMTAGRVTVNGEVATELGTKVDVDRDHIEVDGMPVKLNQGAVYLMLYKPTGYLTTMSDPQERPCVAELVPRDRFPGLFPVGRLDRDTTGLLLFTTDGDLSQDLLHPSKHVYKTYQALVDGHLTDRDLEPLRRGIELDDGLCQPAICRVINAREAEAVAPQGVKPGTAAVEVIIREGRKNQVKRMLSKIHHPVIRLHRCNFAGLELKDVAKGSWRELTDREVQILKSGGIPPKQASAKRNGGKPQDTPASRTRHHGSHGSAPKRNTYRERYTGWATRRAPAPANHTSTSTIERKHCMIVAIDGPAGSGKSTIAKEIARQLGFNKLDTGAMYRAVTFAALDRGIDLDDEAAIDALAEQIEIRFTNGTGEDTRLTIDGQDASAAIRTPQVDANVSKVSAYPGVRAAMLIHQRRAAEDRDIVAEGRDIGTVVFPNAQVKVFLTADPRERARRRVLQRHQNDAQPLTTEQLEAEVDETLDALKQRDKLDSSREVAPLVPAEDAVHVDSTAHTIDEVVRIIEDLINQRR